MANPIPTLSRDLVSLRDGSRCVRCGGHGYHWHHRRSRRVIDEHTHCPCNGVLLCSADHRWAHAHPTAATGEGLIVSSYVTRPSSVVVTTVYGTAHLTCDGQVQWAS